MIYLYVKESPLGLKYLGITIKNPIKYIGSGKHWRLHIKKHNLACKDINTKIIFQTTSLLEISNKGIYYSELWDVVNSEEWANLIPETGYSNGTLGNKQSEETIEKRIKHLRGKARSQEYKDKMSRIITGFKHSEETKEKLRMIKTGTKQSEETINKKVASRAGYKHSEETINKLKINRKDSIKVKNRETEEPYESLTQAAEKLGISRATLCWRLRNNPDTCQVIKI